MLCCRSEYYVIYRKCIFFTCNNFEVDEKSGVDDGRIQLLPLGQVQVGEIRVGLEQPVRTGPQLLRYGVLVVDARTICAWVNELQMCLFERATYRCRIHECVEAVHAGSSCSRKVHETTFEGLLPLRGIPTYTLRIHVIHTHVLQPLALHWIQIYCTVLNCPPFCSVVLFMPPPHW